MKTGKIVSGSFVVRWLGLFQLSLQLGLRTHVAEEIENSFRNFCRRMDKFFSTFAAVRRHEIGGRVTEVIRVLQEIISAFEVEMTVAPTVISISSDNKR